MVRVPSTRKLAGGGGTQEHSLEVRTGFWAEWRWRPSSLPSSHSAGPAESPPPPDFFRTLKSLNTDCFGEYQLASVLVGLMAAPFCHRSWHTCHPAHHLKGECVCFLALKHFLSFFKQQSSVIGNLVSGIKRSHLILESFPV